MQDNFIKYLKLFLILFPFTVHAQPTPDGVQGHSDYQSGSSSPGQANGNSNLGDVNSVLNGGTARALENSSRIQNEAIAQSHLQAQRDLVSAQATATQVSREVDQIRNQIIPSESRSTDMERLRYEMREKRQAQVNQRLVDIASSTEAELPYAFKSPEGAFRRELVSNYQDLYKAPHPGYKRDTARGIGLLALEASDFEFLMGNEEDAKVFQQIAQEMLDLTLGLDPVTAMGRSVFELLTGRNAVTGAELTKFERSISALGILTLGSGSSAARSAKAVTRMFHIFDASIPILKSQLLKDRSLIENGVRDAERLYNKVGHLIGSTIKRNRISGIHTSELINQRYFEKYTRLGSPPFQIGSHVIEVTTLKESTNFVRIHSNDSKKVSGWVVKKSSVEGLTASQIQQKYSIIRPISHVSDVVMPKGQKFLRGNINGFSGPSGAIQYFIVDVKEEWFKTLRRLE